MSENLRRATPILTLRSALAQAQADAEFAEPQGLGADAKLRLLEMRETIHRSLVLKAKLLERGDALRSLADSGAAVPLTASDFRDVAGEWLGITSEWVGIASEEPPAAERKVRSNRFLADLAAIRRGESKGDSVWQALQRERGRTRAAKHRAKMAVRIKPRQFTDASDADAAYKARAEAEKSEAEVMDLDYPPGSWYCNVCWGVVQSDRGEVRLNCTQYVKGRKCSGTPWRKMQAGLALGAKLVQNMRVRAKCFKCSCDRPASEAPEPGAEETLPAPRVEPSGQGTWGCGCVSLPAHVLRPRLGERRESSLRAHGLGDGSGHGPGPRA